MLCVKHNCKMVQLFTSWACDVCDGKTPKKVEDNHLDGICRLLPARCVCTCCRDPLTSNYNGVDPIFVCYCSCGISYKMDLTSLRDGEHWIETESCIKRTKVLLHPGYRIKETLYRPKCVLCQFNNWSTVWKRVLGNGVAGGYSATCANCSSLNSWSNFVNDDGSIFIINGQDKAWDGSQWL